MSCSLCRLPFTPSHSSIYPRPPPPGVLTDKQFAYMKHAVGIGLYIIGLVVDMVFLDNNTFAVNNSPMIVNIVWETENKTFIALHAHCATLLRHRLGFTSEDSEALVDLAIMEKIVGPTMDGAHAGMFKDVNYKSVLTNGDKRIIVDIESLWSPPEDGRAGYAVFDWKKWQERGLQWTAIRPDVFPRFHSQVAATRLCSPPESTQDIITTQPLDILLILLPYLDNRSFVNLLSTCRTLRHHALTTFQPLARERTLELGWAVPTESEYAGFVKRNPPQTTHAGTRGKGSPTPSAQLLAGVAMAHATHSPMYADWFLYLSQVHRTPAMRARRWVWALAGELARVYREEKDAGPYADTIGEDGKVVRSKAWLDYAHGAKQQLDMRPMVLGLGMQGKSPAMSW